MNIDLFNKIFANKSMNRSVRSFRMMKKALFQRYKKMVRHI